MNECGLFWVNLKAKMQQSMHAALPATISARTNKKQQEARSHGLISNLRTHLITKRTRTRVTAHKQATLSTSVLCRSVMTGFSGPVASGTPDHGRALALHESSHPLLKIDLRTPTYLPYEGPVPRDVSMQSQRTIRRVSSRVAVGDGGV